VLVARKLSCQKYASAFTLYLYQSAIPENVFEEGISECLCIAGKQNRPYSHIFLDIFDL